MSEGKPAWEMDRWIGASSAVGVAVVGHGDSTAKP